MPRPRLVICAQEPLGGRLRGPAIRAVELARALSADADVRLAAPAGAELEFHPHDPEPLREALRDADAVLTPPLWPRHVAAVRAAGVPWICDLYAPEPLETLEHFRDRPMLRRLMTALATDRTEDALRHATLLLCASRRQQDLWTGALLATRGIGPRAYDADPSLRRRLTVVPFGLPAEPPVADGHPLRERFGIAPDVPLVLWNGGTWPWLDPGAAIDAVLATADAHLVFLGGADERVTASPRVHVNDDWVPYEARGAALLDADVVISAHHDHLETRYAYRTRLLDALWAGLPIVCSGGDELADLVAREDLGAVAPPGDVAALGAGLARVLAAGPASYAERIAATAAGLTWKRAAAPLAVALDGTAAGAGRSPAGDAPASCPGRVRSRHPAAALRTAGYRTVRPLLDRVGLRDWPRAV